ncbi:AmmeMemoRadiSam system protein A [Caproiciproducens sp. NJN-50]|uniref:AmmeMemoRadiSam system protein A n=1 Tax=Acutalibacteraceae TaxID=3082771 RepID=UPI000FFE1FBB|nr:MULTISPECIES: AmmeMemoRadiSam system protein A [Acutalibacteraceae]QAT50641.1 AmmeMemoRadiSam system protein A [Caproiciproducens sp. NJN-50]
MAVIGAFIMPHPPIIIPSVGKGEERRIQKTSDAYQRAAAEIARMKPETLVVLSPHAVAYADYLHIAPGAAAKGDFSEFGSADPPLEFSCDTQFVSALSDEAGRRGLPAGTFGDKRRPVDHGALVPLTFITRAYRDFRLVRCSISGLGASAHYRFGQCIARAAEQLGRRVVLIASGDLSHKLKEDGPYGFAEEGPRFDREATEAMKAGDFLRFLTFDEEFCEAAAECGLPSFQILAGVFDGTAVKPEFLSYEGPFGVGYAVCGYTPQGPDESRRFGENAEQRKKEALLGKRKGEDEYVRLARMSLENRIIEGKRLPLPEGLPPDLANRRAGVFVSLKKDGRLRGCIGTIQATQSCVAEEIICNAVSAGLRDPRFEPVGEEELPKLVYSVDVLGEAEPAAFPGGLDPARYGVIVRSGERCGLLLPDLPGVSTPQEQVSIALRKAGIGENESYTMERFEVVRHT